MSFAMKPNSKQHVARVSDGFEVPRIVTVRQHLVPSLLVCWDCFPSTNRPAMSETDEQDSRTSY